MISNTRNFPFASSMIGAHSDNNIGDTTDLDDIPRSNMKKRFNFRNRDASSYQTVSSITSIDSINQMKEQLKNLSDTLKMDMKSFKESIHFESTKKVNLTTNSNKKINSSFKKRNKKKSLNDNGFVSNLAYITQQNKNKVGNLKSSFSSSESDEPLKRKNVAHMMIQVSNDVNNGISKFVK